jgi:hypothetical protein
MTVTATMSGSPCGQGTTLQIGAQIFYRMDVFSKDSGSLANCGDYGRTIFFKFGTRVTGTSGTWNNNKVQYLPQIVPSLYLPLINR